MTRKDSIFNVSQYAHFGVVFLQKSDGSGIWTQIVEVEGVHGDHHLLHGPGFSFVEVSQSSSIVLNEGRLLAQLVDHLVPLLLGWPEFESSWLSKNDFLNFALNCVEEFGEGESLIGGNYFKIWAETWSFKDKITFLWNQTKLHFWTSNTAADKSMVHLGQKLCGEILLNKIR